MNYSILPGVRQDHLGRLYQYARFPSGRTIVIPYIEELPSIITSLQQYKEKENGADSGNAE